MQEHALATFRFHGYCLRGPFSWERQASCTNLGRIARVPILTIAVDSGAPMVSLEKLGVGTLYYAKHA